jgi:hypothetical protein
MARKGLCLWWKAALRHEAKKACAFVVEERRFVMTRKDLCLWWKSGPLGPRKDQ